jgi:formylglycine-generating enzyme required for sulfatase activity
MAYTALGIGQGANRVNRGGSWNNEAANCRAANRDNNEPGIRNNNLGFRPAPAPAAPDQMIRMDGTGQ